MLKYLKYFLLTIGLFYWGISHFETLYSWAGKNKIFPDDYRFGDLYRLSYLPQFKEKAVNCTDTVILEKPKNKVHLYLLGDSFAEDSKINTKNFAANKYQFIHWDRPEVVQLDISAKNILILESVERSAKLHFVDRSDEIIIKSGVKVESQNPKSTILDLLENIINTFSNNTKNTEERLWHTALNYDFILYFKEIKANIDESLFERKSVNFNLSANKKDIFYFEEAEPTCPNSAFYKVTDSEIQGFVNYINLDYDYYKKMGFDQVFLSIVPNKVTLLAPEMGEYNHVLERIQNHPNLNVKCIDVYQAFKKQPNSLFVKSDTHWNCYGSSLWQSIVNETISLK